MFDPGNVSSTGEPPTQSSSDITTSAQISIGNDSHQESTLLGSSRSLSVQEPDSGYEASPSSIAEGHNQRFFGEQSGSRQAEIRNINSDDEEGEFTGFHFSESESDDYDTCDCSSSPCNCFRTDSSTTNFTAISNCDNNSRYNSSELSFNRNSSQPITIPNLPSFRFSSNSRISMDVNNVSVPLTRSFPLNFSPRLRVGITELPLSWPSFSSPLNNNCRSAFISRSNSSNRDIPVQNRHNITRQHPARSRRVDSEGSEEFTSEDEFEEDVFTNLPSGETSSSYPTMMTMSSIAPLPDVVLESTDSGRRSRSMSINLPPDREQVLNDIGQRLRRMSDLFVQRRQLRMAVMRARSRTASECDDHLHRNGLS